MCSDCKYLDIKDSKDAKVNGKMYYCKATKSYCRGCANCPLYQKDEKRSKDDIKRVAHELSICDNSTIYQGLAILFIFTVLFIISKLS